MQIPEDREQLRRPIIDELKDSSNCQMARDEKNCGQQVLLVYLCAQARRYILRKLAYLAQNGGLLIGLN